MLDILLQLFLFTSKAVIVVVLVLFLFIGLVAIFSHGKEKLRGRVTIKNLNDKYRETTEALLAEILPKSLFKKFLKEEKISLKKNKKTESQYKKIYVLNFIGDIKASAVTSLREEITAVINIAKPKDEVVVRLESAGGMVHAYGLAAAQLLRIRQKKIPLTVIVDKVAASGGYLMASVANQILAAPFAIIGSIGVIFQLPNFHQLLKDKHIDFEQVTAGNYKRTLTMFGKNTEEGREKLKEEIEDIHHHFKQVIEEYRPSVNIEEVATGETWLASDAQKKSLVDHLQTSDDYLLEKSKNAEVYEITYHLKKSFGEKISSTLSHIKMNLFSW